MMQTFLSRTLGHPFLIAIIGLIGAIIVGSCQYDSGKDFGLIEGRNETKAELQPTMEALLTKTAYLGVTNFYVEASRYPFDSTGIQVIKGEQVSITPMRPSKTWDCSNGGEINAAGFEQGQHRDLWVEPGANFCELIGKIGEAGPFLHLGTEPDFIAQESGTLYLGANDLLPHHCPEPYSCFDDNKGRLFIKIQTTEFRK